MEGPTVRSPLDLFADSAAVAAVTLLVLSAVLLGVCSLTGAAHRPRDGARAISSQDCHPRPGPAAVQARAR